MAPFLANSIPRFGPTSKRGLVLLGMLRMTAGCDQGGSPPVMGAGGTTPSGLGAAGVAGAGASREGVAGDGSHFEAASACAGDLRSATETCADGAVITSGTGHYWINNNVWNRPSDDRTSEQCIWLTCSSGQNLAWGTRWNWTGAYSVKSYSSVVLGWQWGQRMSNTGLPLQISAQPTLHTGWSFAIRQTDSEWWNADVAYDLWIHSIPNPDGSAQGDNQPTDEVMIWLYGAGALRPVGNRVAGAVSLGGTSWDLYQGTHESWAVHSFVRTRNTTTFSMNIGEFLQYLVTERGLESSKYLTSVQAGVEVLLGAGELVTSSYFCTVE
jgi:xyloglucan-specific endo-beta-1,4-glucanase